MHDEILTKEQRAQLPLLKKFSKKFGLVGGTAIALHIGHRRSIDFDLFSEKSFSNTKIRRDIIAEQSIEKELYEEEGQLTVIISGVKWTFFHYPFTIQYEGNYQNYINIPSLLTLAAMKAYAIGQRAKWKDYVDMYFILKDHYSLQEIVDHTTKIFSTAFNEKLLRSQLAYFKDIDYREPVEYLPGFEVDGDQVKEVLKEFSLQ
ncbi:MAG: hypothetical protein COU10_02275 [Candidatus Harrisonbacteria bacterium CG10_big_fil_rev_8_21_14_0_10_45_28]|uniref:Nucleotidyl transferase AbiEii/AbiGii toxin family protein n=1 Tax=Candidatus Harrisonbacteria bacterium CG10_big_fil_rev_8_21_14_0_10_45_28 TaxID=1974586 RepID=A0A2H0UN75_9BACT|nr:MAG: hypothetical protein COU10_02275 [Candidatus Harrisonbacteria bacterium CG10_big_fil_rev_8_21_14_0_10_45_28]